MRGAAHTSTSAPTASSCTMMMHTSAAAGGGPTLSLGLKEWANTTCVSGSSG